MRHWARHWLRTCRRMPLRALDRLARDGIAPEQTIHEFRRLMKAWRALLKLAPAGLSQQARAVRAAAGRLRRGFGPSRDRAVIAGVLRKLCPQRLPPDDAEAAAAAAGALLREQGEAVRTELRRLSAAMAEWSLADETGDFLVRACGRSYRRARRRARKDARRMSIERLHDFRSAVVDLGCQLGFLAPAESAGLRRQAALAERLRSRLGRAIDLDMARTCLAAEAGMADGGRLMREIERRIARQRRRASKLADRLLARRPGRVRARLAAALGRHPPGRASFA
ncbi:CHAD domain-containing protein [Bosea minatitlanensis]